MKSICVCFVLLNLLVLINKVNSEQNNRAINTDWEAKNPTFDPKIYEEVLDPELCARQIKYLILRDPLLLMTCK